MVELLLFDKRGRRVSRGEWLRLVLDDGYRRVAHTELSGGGRVSTVWIGAPPGLTFETLVFDADGEEVDGRGYLSEADALAGHEGLVRAWSGRVEG